MTHSPATRVNDIMLVKLSELVTSTNPVALNFDTNIPATGDVVTVMGYGDTSENGTVSEILLQVDVDTYDDSFCEPRFANYDPETMVCAGTEDGGKDSCQVRESEISLVQSLVLLTASTCTHRANLSLG